MKYYCAIKKIITTLIVFWITFIFLVSLTYKFTKDPETQYIFGTIWEWMKWILWNSFWNGFINYWWYVIWTFELIVSIILLIPIFFLILKLFGFLKNKDIPEYLFALGWLWASLVMFGAVSFHLFTPLWTVVNNDGWSLFRSAVSILILWLVLFYLYFEKLFTQIKKAKY